jgi:Lactoylglutathione lyase and related lyases
MRLFFVFLITTFFIIGCKDLNQSNQKALQEADAELIDQAINTMNPKDQALIFRRTTLIVRDIENSLALYRDAMGMEIIYDQVIKRPHPFEEGAQQSLRLIFLRALDTYQGVLGLIDYEYGSKDKMVVPIRKEGFTPQNVVLLFNSNELEARFVKIKAAPDVEIISEPKLTTYPSYDGTDTLKVMVSKFYDPDGFIVEFNKLLSDL